CARLLRLFLALLALRATQRQSKTALDGIALGILHLRGDLTPYAFVTAEHGLRASARILHGGHIEAHFLRISPMEFQCLIATIELSRQPLIERKGDFTDRPGFLVLARLGGRDLHPLRRESGERRLLTRLLHLRLGREPLALRLIERRGSALTL